MKRTKPLFNAGRATHRFQDNPEEQRFAQAWDAINQPVHTPGTCPTLAYMITDNQRFPVEPSAQERELAATVIQWLGSPVGQSFLRDLGYTRGEK